MRTHLLIDAIVRHLLHLNDLEVAQVLPHEIRALVQFQRRSSIGQWVTLKQLHLSSFPDAYFSSLPVASSGPLCSADAFQYL